MPVAAAVPRLFAAQELEKFISRAFEAVGLTGGDARNIAELMVRADLMGADGHGVFRLPQYIRRIKGGAVNIKPNIRLEREAPGMALVDGDNGMGHLVMRFATDQAIEKAKIAGVAWVGDAKHYFYAGNATITLPWQPLGVTVSINPEVGYEYYSSGVTTNYGSVSDTFWDVGLILNYKAATLDLRYWGTNVKSGTGAVVNQCGGAVNGTNFCGDRFVATLKFDTTFSALK